MTTIVHFEDIQPYSVLHVTPREKQNILDGLDDAITERRNSERDRKTEHLTDLREQITQSSYTLRLGVGEHDRLKHALQNRERGGIFASRLRNAEPECANCDLSGFMQVRVDGGGPWTLCADCKSALQSSHGPYVLEELDPAFDSVSEISFTWPEKTDSPSFEQMSLVDYVG